MAVLHSAVCLRELPPPTHTHTACPAQRVHKVWAECWGSAALLRAVGGAERASTQPHACNGASRAAVRSQEQCKLCSCPRVTVCCGMNHCSCLSFPPGADGPGLFAQCRRGTRQRRGPRLPALSCGHAPQTPPQPDRALTVHTSAHSALRAAPCTLARTRACRAHTARTAAIAHSGVQTGTSVCRHPHPRCWCWRPGPPAAVPTLRPLQPHLHSNAADLSMGKAAGTLRERWEEEEPAEEVGGTGRGGPGELTGTAVRGRPC